MKSALKDMFEANEVAFKIISNSPSLDGQNIENAKALLDSLANNTNATATMAFKTILCSFKQCVEAMHNYRHGQGVVTYDEPLLSLLYFY